MNKRVRIIPWLVAAMVVFFGAVQASADEAAAVVAPTIAIDKTELNNGGTIKVTGQVPAGKQVFLEIWNADKQVKANRFDSDVNKETGKRPYIFYITNEMPAYYKLIVPSNMKDKIDEAKKSGSKWSYSKLLKDMGADIAYTVPAKVKIERYQSTLMASVIGSRGTLLAPMDEKENKKRSMQLVKSRFRSVGNVVDAALDIQPDGTYSAELKIRDGIAPGAYKIVAVVDKTSKSEPVTFENKIAFPICYLDNAGT
ncbi:MAG: sulfite exporter TauE/SafE family protein, partial [Desulfobulbus sp.]